MDSLIKPAIGTRTVRRVHALICLCCGCGISERGDCNYSCSEDGRPWLRRDVLKTDLQIWEHAETLLRQTPYFPETIEVAHV